MLAAPDKMRGTLTAREFCAAVAAAARAAGWTSTALPLADGGEGTVDALGGANRVTRVTGPLGEPVDAPWRLDGTQAVIEMAAASGLALVGGATGNDPVRATTRGTGELILAAIDAGATRVIVGLGGSATVDGGAGALEVLPDGLPAGVRLEVACDVTTTFVEAAAVFGPQKGADAAAVALLTDRLRVLVAEYRARFGVDVAELPGSGAAGGLAGGLASVGATLRSGFDLVAEEVGLAAAIRTHDLVITGEGLLDETSFEGKVVGGVAEAARVAGVRCVAVVGQARLIPHDLEVVDLTAHFGTRARTETARCVQDAVRELLSDG